jgi:hypothetical protein
MVIQSSRRDQSFGEDLRGLLMVEGKVAQANGCVGQWQFWLGGQSWQN